MTYTTKAGACTGFVVYPTFGEYSLFFCFITETLAEVPCISDSPSRAKYPKVGILFAPVNTTFATLTI